MNSRYVKDHKNEVCGGEWYTNNTDHCNYAVKSIFSYKVDVAQFDSLKDVQFRVTVLPEDRNRAKPSKEPFNGKAVTIDIYKGTVTNNLQKPILMQPYVDLSQKVDKAGYLAFQYSLGQTPTSAVIHVGKDTIDIIKENGTELDGVVYLEKLESPTEAYIQATYTVSGSSPIPRKSSKVTASPYKTLGSVTGEEYTVNENDKTKTPLERFGGNKVTWRMKKAPGDDIYSSEQFLILRGYKSDYSDLVSIGSVSLTGFDSEDGDSVKYVYTDEASNQTAFNEEDSVATDPHKIYYVVTRATAYSAWDLAAEKYTKKIEITRTNTLPKVTKVTVEREDTTAYKTNHRVKIRVEMASDASSKCIWNSEANVIIHRKNTTDGNSTVGNKDITITGSLVTWDSTNGVYYAETTDIIDYELNYFTYTAEVQNTTKYLASNSDNTARQTDSDTKCLYYSLAADLRELYATTDQYDQITVSWPAPSGLVTSGQLYRADVTDGDNDNWTKLEKFVVSSGSYTDSNITIHHKYKYKATLSYTSLGQTVTCETTTPPVGQSMETGKITGRIATANGMGLAGVTVQISKKGDDSAEKILVYTDENGSYSKDGLVIDGATTTYTVLPTSDGGVSYVYAENGTIHSYDAVLVGGKTYHSDVDFRPSSDTRINGRVLFDGTTVPVAHANFKLNGKYLYKNAKELVETDGKGVFSFTLPTGLHIDSLQVVKKGHTFKTNGKIKNTEGNTEFALNQSIESITLHDMTKTRLAGRIVGGYVQQAKPLGFGLSKNNIGDSICVVMQLEGDNTAYLVYNDDDVNQKTRIDTCLNYTKQDTTYVNVERHRMTVHANNETGEFFVDLLPVKYKITAITAKGYGSLFNKGMVAPVIDMTDSLTTHTYTYEDDSKTPAVKYTTAYNAPYNYAYHSGINVTYNQMVSSKYGDLSYLGEEKVTYTDIDSRKSELIIAEPDTLGVYHYNLGYPLFVENKNYFIKGRAHEDYYYNNDKTLCIIDEVPVTQGTMVIDNGLTAKTTTVKLPLDKNGSCITTFVASNRLFTQTGEKALGTFNMSLDIDGNYYDADELQAFVTGTRNQTTGVTTCVTDTAANIQLLDILRDPPGSKSFSSIAAGTKWDMTYKLDFSASVSLTFNITKKTGADTFVGTVAAPEGAGTVNGNTYASSSTTAYEFPIPIYSGGFSKSYTYSLTTNETISTSSEATDCGAMSDVFIGATQNMQYSTKDVISVVDSTAYARLLPAISSKDVTLIQQGTSSNGTKFYLVRAEQFSASTTYPVMFNYTGRHIFSQILPNLIKARSELVKKMSQAEAEAMANATKQPVYYTSKDDWDMQEKLATDTIADYQVALPTGTNIFFDRVAGYTRAIKAWIKILLKNERDKINAFKNLQAYETTHSISSGTTYSYTQGESDSDASKTMPYYASATTAGLALASAGTSAATKVVNSALKQATAAVKKWLNKDKNKDAITTAEKMLEKLRNTMMENDLNGKDQTAGTDVKTPASTFSFTVTPSVDVSFSSSSTKSLTNTRTRSFTLGVSDDSYMDIEVYKACVDSTITGYSDLLEAYQACYGTSVDNNVFLNNYIFREVGGATRNPWQDADSTIWYINESNYQPYPLAERTLKIDNPVLTINVPEINNVLPNEAAYFTIRMSNESELGAGATLTKGSPLTLSVVQGSNPYGAQVSIDGTPLGTGMTFNISPNSQLTKTMTVLRGTGFDFDNLQLKLASADGTTSSIQNFSIHYVPSSSPVAIASPGDKWVMNTLNPKDEDGYYMPITVNGFDVNYAGFDHIEMQYKKHTEGETGWTNLCSYYANDSLYQKANGTKEMIKTGTISNFRFYGEKDPVEMQYDIRAVAYSRNGTEFVTNSSPIITGMKDTRPPEVYGKVQPASGILTFTNEIELPFTEDIAYNYLDETNNFTIEGYTNNTEINQGRTLYFPGTSDQCAKTLVDRNLSDRSFTIDLMVQPSESDKKMIFFSQKVNNKSKIKFGITADQHLFATIGDQTVTSDSVVKYANEQLHSIGLVCEKVQATSSTVPTMKVSFFYGNELLTAANGTLSTVYEGVGPVYFGTDAVNPEDSPFHGKMLNARLWNKALNESSIAQFEGKLLNGYQTMLKDYWPLTNSKGNTATDNVSGADLALTGTSWVTATKYSLKLDKEVIKMESAVMQATTTQDYSLGFWFRTADNYTPDDSKLVNIFGIGLDDNPVKGTGGMRIGFYKGNFIFRTGGKDYTLTQTSAVADHSWHYYLMTVSPQMATACIYLDNELITKPNTEDLDGLGSSGARFGSEGFQGNIDMFTHWYMALSKSFQADINDRMLTGQEQSLNVYLPFTQQKTNDQGLYHSEFSPYNEKVVLTTASDGSTKTKEKTLMLKEYTDNNTDKNIFAPMAASQVFKKIPFKWTSTNTSLMIDLNIPDKEIDKQNIHFTVRDVEDLNGNPMVSPISWSLYPDLTRLRWSQRYLTHVKSYGASDVMELEWNNTSGYNINYSITTTSSRITLSETDGIAEPESNHKLKLTLSDQMPLGTYDEYVYINDLDNGLTEVLRINFTVSATEPAWNVTTDASYNQTMSVDACVRLQDSKGTWYIDQNEKDIVAAFDGDVCIGKTYIKANTAIDNSNLYMTVKGKTKLDASGNVVNMPITFMLWNSTTNATSTLSTYNPYPTVIETNFENNGLLGVPDPVEMRPTNLKYQYIDLKQGWNWISFNVIPKNVEKGPNSFLDRTSGLSDGDIFALTGANEFYTYNAKYKMWEGNVDANMYNANNVYQVYAHNDLTLTVSGVEFTDANRQVNINIPEKNGWSHLAYLLEAKQPINTALSDFAIGDKCPVGSVIKSYNAFTVAKADSRWAGSLEYMLPGEGYFLTTTEPVSTTIRYTNTTVYAAKSGSFAVTAEDEVDTASDTASDENSFAGMTNRENNSNMPVIATFADGDAQEGDVLVAYANGAVAGVAQYNTEEKLFFLSVNAQSGSFIRFAKVRNDAVVGVSYKTIDYQPNAVIGSLDKPYLVDFSTTGIDNISSDANANHEMYDLAGRKYNEYKDAKKRQGVYIIDGKKVTH